MLIRFPLLNTAVLPALFIASGLSAGISGSSLIAALFFKEDPHSSDLGSFAAVVGVLLLRVFILYAGQTYSI